ncbi:hypothetical protein AAMO2058_001157100 [Amorphochlora amoebiformis]
MSCVLCTHKRKLIQIPNYLGVLRMHLPRQQDAKDKRLRAGGEYHEAEQALRAMTESLVPPDMIQLALICIRSINQTALRYQKLNLKMQGKGVSGLSSTVINADALFPIVVYVVQRSKVNKLYRCLGTIERFTADHILSFGETGMALSLLRAASSHILHVDLSKFNISLPPSPFSSPKNDSKSDKFFGNSDANSRRRGGGESEGESKILSVSSGGGEEGKAMSLNSGSSMQPISPRESGNKPSQSVTPQQTPGQNSVLTSSPRSSSHVSAGADARGGEGGGRRKNGSMRRSGSFKSGRGEKRQRRVTKKDVESMVLRQAEIEKFKRVETTLLSAGFL